MKLKHIAFSILLLVLFPLSVFAASGKIAVSGPSQAVVGNTITVTVTLSSSTSIGSWEMDLDYNKSYLQLTSSTGESQGTVMVGYTNNAAGTKSVKYTFKFKVLKTGSTTISVPSYDIYANDMSSMSITSSGRTIKLITQQELEASYSKNNDLSHLSVEGYEITPEFNKDTLEYSVTVGEDVKEISINAKASDSKSQVSGVGTHEVTSGINSFPIVVKAENGSEKTYTINVEVKDANPINVTVDGEALTVVKIKEYLPVMANYQEYSVKIDDFDIPAYYNENTKIVLVGLKNSVGDVSLYIYDEAKNTYEIYKEIGINKITIYPLKTTKNLDGYTKDEITINDKKVEAYYLTKNSRFVIIYGVNVETGEEGFYKYDKQDEIVMRLDEESLNTLNENMQNIQAKCNIYMYIIIGFFVIFIGLLIVIFNLMHKKKGPSKKEKNKKKDSKKDSK